MKIFKYFIVSLFIFCTSNSQAIAQNFKLPWWSYPIIIPALIIDKIVSDIKEDISISRVTKVFVLGQKASVKNMKSNWNDEEQWYKTGRLLNDIKAQLHGKPISISNGEVEFYQDGMLRRFYGSGVFLTGKNLEIKLSGHVSLYKTGYIHAADLTIPINIQVYDTLVTVQDNIVFDEKGNLIVCEIKHPMQIKLLDYYINLPKNSIINFTPDGKIYSVYHDLKDSIKIRVQQKNINATYAKFYDNGVVKQCELFDSIALYVDENTLTFDNKEIKFFPDGSVASGRLRGEQAYAHKDLNLVLRYVVSFYPNAMLKDACLVKPNNITINNHQAEIERQQKIVNAKHVEFHENGVVKQCELYDSTTLYVDKNLLTFEGKINFFSDGLIASGRLSNPQAYVHQDLKLILLSDVSFYPNGMLEEAWIEKPFNIALNNHQIKVNASNCKFYENGSIKLFNGRGLVLTGAQKEIDISYTTELYQSGYLKETYLYSPQRFIIQGKEWQITGNIICDESGNLISGDLDNTVFLKTEKNTIKIPARAHIEFDKSGNLFSAIMSDDIYSYYRNTDTMKVVLQNKIINAAELKFYTNGNVFECKLLVEMGFDIFDNTLFFEKGESLYFFENGQLKSGKLSKRRKCNFNNLHLKLSGKIEFYENGNIKTCNIDKSTKIKIGQNKIKILGTTCFYPDGKLLSSKLRKACKLNYHNQEINCVAKYFPTLWFNKEGEIIALENQYDELMKINGKDLIIQKDIDVGYTNYENREVDFISLNPKFLVLPEHIKLPIDVQKIFVKAKDIYLGDSSQIFAKDVTAIMFLDDATIKVKGEDVFCKQMTWIDLAQYQSNEKL